MAGLPKKYAKMGFKKGWIEYKKTKKTPKVRTMTTKRKSTAKKAVAKPKTLINGFVGKLISKAMPVAYGYMREPASDWLANSAFGKMLPNFGKYGDEASLLMINYGLTSFGGRKNPLARKALQISENIELSNIGREFYDQRKDTKSNDFSDDF